MQRLSQSGIHQHDMQGQEGSHVSSRQADAQPLANGTHANSVQHAHVDKDPDARDAATSSADVELQQTSVEG